MEEEEVVAPSLGGVGRGGPLLVVYDSPPVGRGMPVDVVTPGALYYNNRAAHFDSVATSTIR